MLLENATRPLFVAMEDGWKELVDTEHLTTLDDGKMAICLYLKNVDSGKITCRRFYGHVPLHVKDDEYFMDQVKVSDIHEYLNADPEDEKLFGQPEDDEVETVKVGPRIEKLRQILGEASKLVNEIVNNPDNLAEEHVVDLLGEGKLGLGYIELN